MRKVSHPRARFNGRLKLPDWLGKDGTAQTLGQAWLLQKREVEEVSTCVGVSVGLGLSWSVGISV
jgi:hypothetical protein